MRFVRHPARSEWGLGAVEGEDASNVDILFEGVGRRKLTKSFKGLLEVAEEDVAPDHPLRSSENWPRVERDGKRAGATRELPKQLDPLIESFLQTYPNGLRSQECDDAERTPKVGASTFAQHELAPEVIAALLERGDHADIVKRTRRVLGKANLVFPNELTKFSDLPSAALEEVAGSIARLVTAGERTPAALEQLATTLSPHGAAKWTIVSLVPFLLHPARWPFVKPTFIVRTALATGIDVEYETRPSARTYQLICDLYEQVKTLLDGLGRPDFVPRDFIDVQTFLWVASQLKPETHDVPTDPAAH